MRKLTLSQSCTAISGAALCAALILPMSAQAQIDEVITTAQRRVETTQDVPVAVTVLSAEDLEVKQIEDTLNIASFVPNLNLATNTGTANAARIFLRGIGEDESRGAVEPAVGTYVDGVYYGRLVGSLFDLVDLEQIEVLRGPQGTLYGRNSNGGAIKITTVTPELEQFGGNARLRVGNYGLVQGRGTLNVPIGENTALRANALYTERDGLFDINPNGAFSSSAVEKVGAQDTLALRASLYHEQPGWSVRVIADYSDDNSDPIPASLAPSDGRDQDIFTVEPAPGRTCTADPADPVGPLFDLRPIGCFTAFSNETQSQGLSAQLTYDLGSLELQSTSAYRELEDDLSSWIGLPYAQATDQDQASQEITLSSDYAGPFNFVAGGFYFKEDLQLAQTFLYQSEINVSTESFAVFGQGEVEFDKLTLTGGLRYTDETRDFVGRNLNRALIGGQVVSRSEDLSYDELSYSGKVDYAATDDILVFASYSTGFKGAGFSPDCLGDTACYLPVDQEEVATIEVGFKSVFADNRVRINGTYFNNQYDNLQIGATVPGVGFTRFAVDETEIEGTELEFVFSPTSRFDLSANLGILSGGYKSLTQLQAESLLTTNNVNCVNGTPTIRCALGLELKNAPGYKANIAATYTHPLTTGDIVVSGDISFEDDSFSLVANQPLSSRSPIPNVLNGRIAYRPYDAGWSVALWARNIDDDQYWRAASNTGGLAAIYAAEPATYGVDLGFDF